MKSMNKLLKRKKSKIGSAAKILLPVAGAIAVKKLWDNKESLISDDLRSKVLEKTEAVQDKVQKFHDLVQNTSDESAESVFVDDDVEETAETGEIEDVINEEIAEETVEQTEEKNEEIDTETKEGEKESENN